MDVSLQGLNFLVQRFLIRQGFSRPPAENPVKCVSMLCPGLRIIEQQCKRSELSAIHGAQAETAAQTEAYTVSEGVAHTVCSIRCASKQPGIIGVCLKA